MPNTFLDLMGRNSEVVYIKDKTGMYIPCAPENVNGVERAVQVGMALSPNCYNMLLGARFNEYRQIREACNMAELNCHGILPPSVFEVRANADNVLKETVEAYGRFRDSAPELRYTTKENLNDSYNNMVRTIERYNKTSTDSDSMTR